MKLANKGDKGDKEFSDEDQITEKLETEREENFKKALKFF